MTDWHTSKTSQDMCRDTWRFRRLHLAGYSRHRFLRGNRMRISVIGTGYLGAVHAACMAELGHEVIGIDADPEKIAALAEGRAPFYEPGLPELLSAAVHAGRLQFSTSLAAHTRGGPPAGRGWNRDFLGAGHSSFRNRER